jgi:hypothetical protein
MIGGYLNLSRISLGPQNEILLVPHTVHKRHFSASPANSHRIMELDLAAQKKYPHNQDACCRKWRSRVNHCANQVSSAKKPTDICPKSRSPSVEKSFQVSGPDPQPCPYSTRNLPIPPITSQVFDSIALLQPSRGRRRDKYLG